MAASIIEVMADSLDPTSVSNALYEVMVEWRSVTIELSQAESRNRKRSCERKKRWLERVISRFINRDPEEARLLMSEHFFSGAMG